MLGFKYFDFNEPVVLSVRYRGNGNGIFWIATDEWGKKETVSSIVLTPSKEWSSAHTQLEIIGEKALYLIYEGEGALNLLSLQLS